MTWHGIEDVHYRIEEHVDEFIVVLDSTLDIQYI